MNSGQQVVQPESFRNEESGSNGVVVLHARLRKMILNGTILPGSMLSQVKLAEMFGVGRIPLREALRMLQEEGLVEAGHNQRARVPSFDPIVVDSLYANRILLIETLSICLTVPHQEQADVDALEQALADMHVVAVQNDIDRWEEPHRRFHRLLVGYAEAHLCHTLSGYTDRCEDQLRMYYRYISAQGPKRTWEAITAEHRSIVQACTEEQSEVASHRSMLHLARTALTMLGQMTTPFDPVAIRMALSVIGANSVPSEEKQMGKYRGNSRYNEKCDEKRPGPRP